MPIANTDDALALVVKRIMETAAVATIIAPGAVFTAYPRAGQDEVPMPCVVLSLESGDSGDANLALMQTVITIWTYSRVSSSEAGQLHQAVITSIQREHIRSTVTLAGGALANPAAVACDFRGGMTDQWVEVYSAWARRSNWLLSYVATP